MRQSIAKKVFAEFDRQLKSRLPNLECAASGSAKGTRLYLWKPSEQVTIYIMLVLAPNSDSFTCEGALSTKHRFPIHLYPMSPLGNPKAEIPPADPIDGEFRFRIPELWDAGKDTWWHIRGDHDRPDMSLEEFTTTDWQQFSPPEYSDELIRAVVESVISRIESDALPFMKAKVARVLRVDA